MTYDGRAIQKYTGRSVISGWSMGAVPYFSLHFEQCPLIRVLLIFQLEEYFLIVDHASAEEDLHEISCKFLLFPCLDALYGDGSILSIVIDESEPDGVDEPFKVKPGNHFYGFRHYFHDANLLFE